jgi:hypothetical protein
MSVVDGSSGMNRIDGGRGRITEFGLDILLFLVASSTKTIVDAVVISHVLLLAEVDVPVP